MRVGQRVEQRGLAGVGVAGEGDERHAGADAVRTLGPARARHLFDAAAERLDALAHHAPVHLELGLAGAAHVHAGAEAAHDEALAAHAREFVLELGEVHLHGALQRVRVLAEHGEDELRAVEHVGVDRVEHGRDLRRGEIVLADGHGGLLLRHGLFELDHLALAEVGARIGRIAVLDDVGDPLHVGRAQKLLDLDQLLVLAGLAAAARDDREHDGPRGRPRWRCLPDWSRGPSCRPRER